MAKKSRVEAKDQSPDAAEWPVGMPYTLYFPRRGGYAAADIEYSAPLPRVGDMVEYIDTQTISHWYVVSEVVHTFQSSQAVEPDSTSLLRSGLPAVYLAKSRRKGPRHPS
jgi:hypothetical protein